MLRQSVKTLVVAAAASLFVAGTASATALSLQYLGAASGYRYLMKDNTANSAFGEFIAWCLDISHWLGTGGDYPYETTTTPFNSSHGLDAAQQNRLQGFFDANYFVGLELDIERSAGFQMGLWEALYDDDHSLTINTTATDDFRGIAGNTAADTAFGKAGDYLTAAKNYTGAKKWNLTFLESQSNRQNLVTVSAVPLPAAGLLLFVGLAGLGMVARHRRN